MRHCYTPKKFSPPSLETITTANSIIVEYQADGYDLTLRQLYYQMVARGHVPNNDREYKKLGGLISDARLAGLVDWEAIVDRTRNLASNSHWDSPEQIVEAVAQQYAVDKWEGQEYRPEVWVEKEALAGVVERIARELDVSYFSCRGYVSQSEMWVAAQRLIGYSRAGQKPLILHLGDHDPSGIDMTRDITDRLALFGVDLTLRRLALNWDQIEEFQPPPNPAKLSDSRCTAYMARFGDESWELDALDPRTLSSLIETAVRSVRDEAQWAEAIVREARERTHLTATSERWVEVVEFLETEISE